MAPVQSTKNMFDFLISLTEGLFDIYSKKKYDLSAIANLIPIFTKIQSAFDGASKISFELSHATEDDKKELCNVLKTLNLDDKQVEGVIKDIMAAMCKLHDVYQLIAKHTGGTK